MNNGIYIRHKPGQSENPVTTCSVSQAGGFVINLKYGLTGVFILEWMKRVDIYVDGNIIQ